MKRTMKNLTGEERRKVTIDAVLQLAAERNPEEITTAAIAGKMKLTQGALFRHFPSKDALWESVMQWVDINLMRTIDEAVGHRSPVEALERMFLAHIDFVNRRPGVPRILFAELQKPDATPAKTIAGLLLKRYAKRLDSLLEQGIEAGVLDPCMDVKAASGMFIGTVQGLVMQSMIAGKKDIDMNDARKVFRVFLRGITKC